jgi:hypothetical protein
VIDEADRRLSAFIREATGVAGIWLDAPQAGEKREGVGLYLLELAESPPPRGATPAPLQLQLRYLVTAWSTTVEKEHKLLGDLAFAALGREDLSAAFRPIDPALWTGFGIPPRAAFLLQVPLRLERKAQRGPPVREITTQFVSSLPLDGIVIGPGDVAIAGASVELPKLGLSASTGPDGRFRFARVPAEGPMNLRVSAKGEVQDIHSVFPERGAPLTIRMKLGEA